MIGSVSHSLVIKDKTAWAVLKDLQFETNLNPDYSDGKNGFVFSEHSGEPPVLHIPLGARKCQIEQMINGVLPKTVNTSNYRGVDVLSNGGKGPLQLNGFCLTA